MTLKKQIVEKTAIACLLLTIAVSTLGADFQVGGGFKIDTMEKCQSYEIRASAYDHRLPDDCISVFKK